MDNIRLPDVTPSTLYELAVNGSDKTQIARANTNVVTEESNEKKCGARVYSFLLHDNARFAHLLQHLYKTS